MSIRRTVGTPDTPPALRLGPRRPRGPGRVEHGPYGRQIALLVTSSATVVFTYRHHCRADQPTCGAFGQYVRRISEERR